MVNPRPPFRLPYYRRSTQGHLADSSKRQTRGLLQRKSTRGICVASEQLRLYNYMVVVVSTAGTGVLTHSDPLSCTESRQHDQQGSSSNAGETIMFEIV